MLLLWFGEIINTNFELYESLIKTVELEDLYYKYLPQGSFPCAWLGHIPFIFYLISVKKPNLIVELGTHAGCSYFGMCEAVKLNKLQSNCFAVDTWQGDAHAGFYPDAIFNLVEDFNKKNYQEYSILLRMTFDNALKKIEDNSIDLLHIDGFHTYQAVKHDFETWLPKVSSGGIILFHDTNVKERDFGVYKLWEEIRSNYPSIEFKHSFGLGVMQKRKDPSLEFFKFNKKELNEFISKFSLYGNFFQQRFFFGKLLKTKFKNNG